MKASRCTQVCVLTFPTCSSPKSLSRTSVSTLSRYHGSQPRPGARDIIEIKMMDEQHFGETFGKNVESLLWGLTGTKASWRESGESKNLRLSTSDHKRDNFSFLTEGSAAYGLQWTCHKTKKMPMYSIFLASVFSFNTNRARCLAPESPA